MVFRVIARLDVKPPDLVKGVHLEGLRKIGRPIDYARNHYEAGVDEIIYQDIVASLYGRNHLSSLLRQTAENLFIPVTAGGGIRNVKDAVELIRSGADRIVVNTAAVQRPRLIEELASSLGSQAVVVGIEAIRADNNWLIMTDNGREHAKRTPTAWAEEVQALGAGEIVLTSIDREGTLRGFDLELIHSVRNSTTLPLIAHGGAGNPDHVMECASAGADGVAIAAALHSKRMTPTGLKAALNQAGLQVRT